MTLASDEPILKGVASMLTPCRSCGHALRSELVFLRSSRFLVWYDDDKASATHAERVRVCPRCGVWLLGTPPDELAHAAPRGAS